MHGDLLRCAPEPFCRCCECVGRRCLISHPGHSHRSFVSPDGAVVLERTDVRRYLDAMSKAVEDITRVERLREMCDA